MMPSSRLEQTEPTPRRLTSYHVATGLLLAMAGVFVLARLWVDRYPALGYVQAFAEAAMVGGLADWFAVTALFRHPLGLPIPHTAIIPRNKDRIGDALAGFLRTHFLIPSVVARRMARLDVGSAVSRFLAQPQGLGGRLRYGLSQLAGDVLESLDHRQLGGLAKAALAQRLAQVDFAPLIGQALDAAMRDGRHAPVLDAIVRWAATMLKANEELIRQMVHDRAGKLLRWTGLDAKLANAILDGLLRLTEEMRADPQHPLRLKAQQGLEILARRLQSDARMQAKVAAIRDEIIANPAMQGWLDSLWEQARLALLRAARDPQAALAGRLGETLRQAGAALQENERLRTAFNRITRRAVAGAASTYGDSLVKLVSETVRGWDAHTLTQRMEREVGSDLQYIRINGTLVGGMVGVALHAVQTLL